VQWGSHEIRIIVLRQIPRQKRNALWELFSGVAENVLFGADNYRWRRPDGSTVINELYQNYKIEGIDMPYTWEDYLKEKEQERLKWLKSLSPETRLKGLSKKDILKLLSIEDRLEGLSAESRKELLKLLSIEDRLEGLSAEEIEAYLKKLRRHKN
jgi:hypothetical protein